MSTFLSDKETKSERLTFRLEKDLAQKLSVLATKENRSPSNLVHTLVRESVESRLKEVA